MRADNALGEMPSNGWTWVPPGVEPRATWYLLEARGIINTQVYDIDGLTRMVTESICKYVQTLRTRNWTYECFDIPLNKKIINPIFYPYN